jgi:hypothetical protein
METYSNWLPFLASIVVVVLGYIFGLRKQSSDVVSQMAEAVKNLIVPLNCRIDLLEATVATQEKELVLLRPLPAIVAAMTRGIHILITQIRKHGLEPDWVPE